MKTKHACLLDTRGSRWGRHLGQTPYLMTNPLGGVRDGVFDLTRLIYLILPAAVSHIV